MRGIDVSNHQGSVNWASVAGSGVELAVAKATEDVTYRDPTFRTNWNAMQAYKLLRGAYHFGRPKNDAIAQARFFLGQVGPLSGDDFVVLDLELDDGAGSPAAVRMWAKVFCEEVRSLTRRTPWIYTNTPFWNGQVGKALSEFPLWLAAYPNKYARTGWPDPFHEGPSSPQGWEPKIWQFAARGTDTVPGVNGRLDLNITKYTRAEIARFSGTLPQEDDDMPMTDQQIQQLLTSAAQTDGHVANVDQRLADNNAKLTALIAAVQDSQKAIVDAIKAQ